MATLCNSPDAKLSLREATLLAEVPENRVRKDIESGWLATYVKTNNYDRKLNFAWDHVFALAVAYRSVLLTSKLRKIVFERFAEESCHFHRYTHEPVIHHGLDVCPSSPVYTNRMLQHVHLDNYVCIDSQKVINEVSPRVILYAEGLTRIESRPDVFGGEPVFKKTRLSVMHIGELVEKGVSIDEIIEDYASLDETDVKFAHLYFLAHPAVGRPRNNKGGGRLDAYYP